MMTITVDSSRFKNLARTITKQVEWATVTALTDTAQDLQGIEKQTMVQTIDRPTPFTLSGVRYNKATRGSMQSTVYIAPIQAKYLRLQIDGGSVGGRKAAPVQGSMNQYGNLPSGLLRRIKSRRYDIKSGGKFLTFQRTGNGKRSGSKLVAVGTESRSYGKIFPFYERANSRVPTYFKRVFGRHLRAALASAL